MREVLIIGAGASGLAAAVTASRAGCRVTVLEKEKKAARKLLRTGNGRCNLANASPSSGHYEGADASFAMEVMKHHPLPDLLAFFRGIGIPTRSFDGWYYPASEEASAVADALLAEAVSSNVRIKLNEEARLVRHLTDGTFSVRTSTWEYRADAVIIAAGSPAGLPEGTPDALNLLKPFRLPYEPFSPALVSLEVKDTPGWAGARARARAALFVNGEEIQAENGQIQFTKKGLSGIPIFNLSIRAGEALKNHKRTDIRLDLLSGLPERDEIMDHLSKLAVKAESSHEASEFLHIFLDGLIPEKISDVLMKKIRPLSDLPSVLGGWTIPIRATGSLPEAQAARGGIRTEAIRPDTMMVRSVPGLFLTGELLEPVGHCGGFNLSFAWVSGMLAGRAASEGL